MTGWRAQHARRVAVLDTLGELLCTATGAAEIGADSIAELDTLLARASAAAGTDPLDALRAVDSGRSLLLLEPELPGILGRVYASGFQTDTEPLLYLPSGWATVVNALTLLADAKPPGWLAGALHALVAGEPDRTALARLVAVDELGGGDAVASVLRADPDYPFRSPGAG